MASDVLEKAYVHKGRNNWTVRIVHDERHIEEYTFRWWMDALEFALVRSWQVRGHVHTDTCPCPYWLRIWGR